jgi:hypothetical protein
MPPRRKPTIADRHAWLEQVRQIADVGDRWLVSIGQSVHCVSLWAQEEADAALRPDPGSTPRSTPRHERRTRKSKSARSQSECASSSRPSVGLVSATPAQSSVSCGDGPENPPGVLPLVQALGRVVADHQDGSYSTLASDERLWTLVDLLQVLAQRPRPDSEVGGPAECPQEPATREH